MNLEPTNADYDELLKDERTNRLISNIILHRLLKEALEKNLELSTKLKEQKIGDIQAKEVGLNPLNIG